MREWDGWNDEVTETMKRMWEDGVSATYIALRLGCGRGAVLGKAHRLGYKTGNPKQPARPKKTRPQAPAAPAGRRVSDVGRPVLQLSAPASAMVPARTERALDSMAVESALIEEYSGTVALVDAEPHHCRYPVGDTAKSRFCGQRRVRGLSYCAHHASRCLALPSRLPLATPPATAKGPGPEPAVEGGSTQARAMKATAAPDPKPARAPIRTAVAGVGEAVPVHGTQQKEPAA